jgi:hypothetical protein
MNLSVMLSCAAAALAGMWHDGILSPTSSSSSSNTDAAAGQVYTLTQNPGVFASNFIPLWAGLAEGDELQGAQVVAALQSSGLVGPAGEAFENHVMFSEVTVETCFASNFIPLWAGLAEGR